MVAIREHGRRMAAIRMSISFLTNRRRTFTRARRWTEEQALTARQRRLPQMRVRRSVSRAPPEEGQRVANLDGGVLLPAGALEDIWRVAFERPVHDLSAVVLHVHVDVRVRIGPLDFR